ncbi:methyltransferase domain-containing protein [Maribellus comscasis]|uniref:Methyltransferase domain-containing protein n=1 Tax=Maribellus comscasis TaxID=2681766 RepID=A0A6I6JPT6_9BACT|nr:class I SAM-dependent methyltransferase [Maribellus comscasis]QGY43068.1 methyltransferase domain-containing protein [Maribellus comscasis]
MNIKEISTYTIKPELYTPGTDVMWTNEYISKQLLQVHLNTEIDLASRKGNTIKKTTDWILGQTQKTSLGILDLGCGPGLYSELLTQKGHKVTAVDFSKNSIEYAKKHAEEKQLNICYKNEDYRSLQLEENQFDLVILIYTDYCVLKPSERKQLLSNIKTWLKPGGTFIFDVNNDQKLEQKIFPRSWEAQEKGFWSDKPYLALSESFHYTDEKVILYQHVIVNEYETPKVYRFYTHFFSETDIKNELLQSGFKQFNFYINVLPAGDLWNGEQVIFCVVKNTK